MISGRSVGGRRANPRLDDVPGDLPRRAADQGHPDEPRLRSTSGHRPRSGCDSSLGEALVEMTPTTGGWWSPGDNVPDPRTGTSTTATCSATTTRVLPDPRSRRQPLGVHERSRSFDPAAHDLAGRRVDRPAARRLGGLRAARRHVHPRGHVRRRARQARPPALDRRGLRRADAGQRVQRHPQLGVRRRPVVGGPRAVRRPGGLPALRRRLPRRRDRRDPGRRLQPPRTVRELPAGVRALPQVRPQHLGRPGQPRRRGLGTRCGGCILDNVADVAATTTTSTGCGWTPCTRSTTSPRRTSSRRWRSRSRRCRPTTAGR